jgi:3-hydroxyisobutyrate dehydrogenase-like beta-hydroxyacid dehydrogenase
MKIHFIGVGKMGLPMAGHLRAAGHDVTVQDLDAQRLALASAQGLEALPADTGIRNADAVLSSLPHDQALLAVARLVASCAGRALVYADTSTVSPQASAEAAVLLDAAGVQYLRCTVSGNNKMAEAAQLTTMVSGPRAAYDKLLPLLAALGPNRFYLGDAEQARLMKLVVNLMIAQTSAMLSEALTLGRKGGLDWQDMWRVLGASAVASPILKAKAAQLSQRDFTPTFTVEQMLKDIGLILDAGAASEVPLPQTAMTQQLMRSAMALGDGQEDYAAIIKTAERAAGVPPLPQDKP